MIVCEEEMFSVDTSSSLASLHWSTVLVSQDLNKTLRLLTSDQPESATIFHVTVVCVKTMMVLLCWRFYSGMYRLGCVWNTYGVHICFGTNIFGPDSPFPLNIHVPSLEFLCFMAFYFINCNCTVKTIYRILHIWKLIVI